MITFSKLTQLLERTQSVNPKVFRSLFNKLDSKVINKDLSINKITALFRTALYNFPMINVSKESSPHVSPNTLNINAGYIHDDDPDYAEIEFDIIHNPTDKTVKLSSEEWRNIKRLFTDALIHEFIHNAQYMSRGGINQKTNKKYNTPDALYHSNPDEMEAFSVNAAAELMRFYKTKEKVKKALRNYGSIGLKPSPVMDSYISLFPKGSNVIKKFLKMVTINIDKYK